MGRSGTRAPGSWPGLGACGKAGRAGDVGISGNSDALWCCMAGMLGNPWDVVGAAVVVDPEGMAGKGEAATAGKAGSAWAAAERLWSAAMSAADASGAMASPMRVRSAARDCSAASRMARASAATRARPSGDGCRSASARACSTHRHASSRGPVCAPMPRVTSPVLSASLAHTASAENLSLKRLFESFIPSHFSHFSHFFFVCSFSCCFSNRK